MKVILLEDVRNLGKTGDQVVVKDGFGRNYLIPRQMALPATEANQRVFANERKAREKKAGKLRGEAEGLAQKLAEMTVSVTRLAGEEDKLFGSVTNADVAEALVALGVQIDKRKIEMAPIKSLGVHEVPVHLYATVTAMLKVEVLKQQPPVQEEPQADVPAEEAQAPQA